MKEHNPRRMEIWFACLGKHPATSVQEGTRLVLVISNDISNEHANTITVLPMTSKMKKPWLPSHVCFSQKEMEKDNRYHDYFAPSTILAEQITTLDKKAFRSRVGSVADESKRLEIDSAVWMQLGEVLPDAI